jgi:putative ABC transport system permease protein
LFALRCEAIARATNKGAIVSVSLARASLIYDWRRYLAAVLAVTFAGLLVLVQLALLLGLFGSVSIAIDKSKADLWIGFRNTKSVDLGRAVVSGSDTSALIHPMVKRVEPMSNAFADLRRADGVAVSVFIYAIDPRPDGIAFARMLSAQQRALLEEPDAVLIDVADQGKLAATTGSLVEINGKRTKIVGMVEGIRGVGGVNILASHATARRMAPDLAGQPTYLLLKLDSNANPKEMAKDLADRSAAPKYSVWTAEDFSIQSQTFWLLESGAGIGSGFASLLALIVGVVITSQTLSAAILASLKEYAALRALGVAHAALRKVVLEQAFWVGVVGLTITGALTLGIAWMGNEVRIAMAFPWWLVATIAVIVLMIAVGSGVMALRPLFKAQPADLLR